MIIIPAIDIIEGKCVRLSEGSFATQKIYHEEPLAVAKQFEQAGLKRLHLVDLDGARAGKVKNWQVLESIAGNTSLSIDFSGGLSTQQQLQKAIDAGADFLCLGSTAARDPEQVRQWIGQFGAERFIIGADIKNGRIAVQGWQATVELGWEELIRAYRQQGISKFFCTDISQDGLLKGPSIPLYREILACFPAISLVASGGVSSIKDLDELKKAGCSGAIVGKAIYENRISLEELKKFNEQC